MARIRRLKVGVAIAGERREVWIEIGHPAPGFHPLHFQRLWLRECYGGELGGEPAASSSADSSAAPGTTT